MNVMNSGLKAENPTLAHTMCDSWDAIHIHPIVACSFNISMLSFYTRDCSKGKYVIPHVECEN